MALRLADGMHAVMIDADLVFLCPSQDTYFCLPLEPGALTLAGEELVPHVPGLDEALRRAGLAVETTLSGRRSANPAPPPPGRTARRLLEERPPARRAGPWPRHWIAIARAALAASRGRTQPLTALLGATRGAGQAEPSARLLSDLHIYRHLAPWLPLDGLCLFRSHMLLAYLRALGHEARWVFGVRTWPFRAHCWLQVGDVALDDEAERLAAYAPILAV